LDALSFSALQNATICDGETSSLSASASGGNGNYTYTWADQSGTVVGSGTNITVSPSITTTYIVTVDDGCTIPMAFDAVTITVNPLPSVAFTVDNPISCAPLDVIFTNNSNPQGSNCVWDFGDGTTTATCGPVSHTYTNVGCYDVSLTVSETGCTNSLTQTSMVCVVDDPVANFAFTPQTIDIFDPQIYFDNTSLNATTYSWNFGDGSGSSVENPVHTFPNDEEGEYMICLTALNDYGCESEICKPIIVEEELIFYMPNSFTPDGDAHNQTFKPVFTSGFDPYDFNLLIFNRWGEVIWESHDASVGWDGTYGGEMVQDGTYVWKVEFKVLKNDERMIKTGHVNVIR
jgi:gliding motility-associated-like protein